MPRGRIASPRVETGQMRRLLTLLLIAAATTATVVPAGLARAATAPLPAQGTLRGTVVSVGWSQITVRPRERMMSVTAALSASADAVAAGDYPYVWGGGHPLAGVPSPARRGGPVGFDCSGTVAAVLTGAGLWPAGTGVPSDAGIVAQLRSEGLLARGAGSVTLWDDPGVHIFLALGARFFGTSDGGGPSPLNPDGGAGWLDDGAPDTLSHHYHPWHLVASALAGRVPYGPTFTLGLGPALAQTASGFAAGDRVAVAYATHAHALLATSIAGL